MTVHSTVNRDREEFRKRAEELVKQMTLVEKVSQMLHGAPAIERLGIPAYNWWNEALHGVARAGTATVFPQAIGMAATFDPELLRKVGDVVSTEGRAKFHAQFAHGDTDIYKGLTFWAPNVNIFRDPRWGRGHETYGEDPYLTSRLGVAYIQGLQGDDPTYLKSAACAKHYAVHSGPEDIRHSFDAIASRKDMYETYLPAFKACVQEADVESVMGSYNRVNGEAACASETLLHKILREDWGFVGHVVSDCWAIRDIFGGHGLTDNPVDAVALAIRNGCDLNCGSCYGHAVDAVIQDKLSEERIDEAVTRLFTTRMLLGLFDDAEKVPFSNIPYLVNDSAEHAAFNREVARKIPVLLKNDGTLPLKPDTLKTIGVIGPNANNRMALEGNYEGTASRYYTVSEGIQDYADAHGIRVLLSEGCHLFKDRTSNIAKASDRLSEVQMVCEASDVIVAVFGLDPGLEGEEGDQGNQFASGDKPNILFPGLQRDVLETIYSYNKPVVLLVLSGSALAMDRDDEKASAIMQCWYPGAMGGKAIADLLFGEASPQGKLPLSFYSEEYELPAFTDYSMTNRTYRFTSDKIVYPFGFGLTYSSFTAAPAVLDTDTITAEGIRLRVSAKNTGTVAAAETLQAYVQAPELGTPQPQLQAFCKCPLGPGETAEYELFLPESAFSVINEEGETVYPQGTYRIYVGFSQPDLRSVTLMGKAPQEIQVKRGN